MRDRGGVKHKLYERSAVREYWIVDPDEEAVEVWRRDDEGGLRRVAELRRAAADSLSTPLFAGLEIPLDRLFAN